jgi:hypothetical protein
MPKKASILKKLIVTKIDETYSGIDMVGSKAAKQTLSIAQNFDQLHAIFVHLKP